MHCPQTHKEMAGYSCASQGAQGTEAAPGQWAQALCGAISPLLPHHAAWGGELIKASPYNGSLLKALLTYMGVFSKFGVWSHQWLLFLKGSWTCRLIPHPACPAMHPSPHFSPGLGQGKGWVKQTCSFQGLSVCRSSHNPL